MKKNLFASIIIMLLTPAALQAVPSVLHHQGRILLSDSEPLSGSAETTFTLYNAAVSGSAQWSETLTLVYDNGYYTVELGTSSSFDMSIFNTNDLYLGITLTDHEEFSPRSKLTSVPYAFKAGSVTGSVDAEDGLHIDGNLVIDSNGQWVGSEIPLDYLPSELSDGDDDTLGNLACEDDQVPVRADGEWVCGTASGSGDLTGSGTAGFLSKFSDSQTLTDSIVTEADGQIGIGTDSPNDVLTVEGPLSVRNQDSSPTPATGYGKIYTKSGASGSGEPGGPLVDTETVVLMNMDGDYSASQHGVTANGDPVIDKDYKRFGTSSMFLDGTDYLSITDSDDWDFGTGDFTIDFWAQPTTDVTAYDNIIGHWVGASGGSWILEYYSTSGARKISMWINGSGPIMTSTTELSTDTFSHVAVVRSSGVITMYINGTAEATYSIGGTAISNVSGPLLVGSTNASHKPPTHLDEIRISKGIARWTSNFTPPIEPYEADNDTHLLLHFDGDISAPSHSITHNGDPTLSGDTGKFGGSYYFDGDDYLTLAPSSDWNFGGGDFTIDFWFNLESNSGNSEYMVNIGTQGSAPVVAMASGAGTGLDFYTSVSGWMEVDNVITHGSWSHIAFVRNGSNFYMFQDGTLLTQKVASGSISSNLPLFIGKRSTLDQHSTKGYLDEIRISKGIARWTEDFIVPDNPYALPPSGDLGGGLFYMDNEGNEYRIVLESAE